jgi:hypothetical protein
MHFKKVIILFILVLTAQQLLAQRNRSKLNDKKYNESPTEEGYENYLNFGDTIYIMIGVCKNKWIIRRDAPKLVAVVAEPVTAHVPFIKIHGNILYNFSYRSYIDTPFAQNNLQQHLIQTNLHFVIKDKYPVQMSITNRSSNSPYFKNLTDVNFNFNRRVLLDNIKNNVKTKALGLVSKDALLQAEKLYENKQQLAQQLQAWINNPARVQEFVEEKERALLGNIGPIKDKAKNLNTYNSPFSITDLEGIDIVNLPKETKGLQGRIINKAKEKIPDTVTSTLAKIETLKNINASTIKDRITDSVKAKLTPELVDFTKPDVAKVKASVVDSAKNKWQNVKDSATAKIQKDKFLYAKDSSKLEKYNAKKEQLVKLKEQIKSDEAKISKLKKNVLDSVNKIKRDIAALQTPYGLFSFMKQKGIAKNELTKAERLLLSVNQVGIGRTYVDYSELTVKNISLAGINVEMNPNKFYVAFAAGKVNYRFRDFIIKNNNALPDQSLYIVRAGIGQKEKNNFIVSFYNGKKDQLNYTSSSTRASVQRVLGISAEVRFVLNENNYIIGEVAKSSYNINANVQPTSTELVGKATNLKIHTNEAYSIKLFSQHPQTNTKLTAYYKKIGENFQSFNLFPTNINQDAWMVKANQLLWKKRLSLDASVRKNDFVSPIAAPATFTSETIFKSFQASVRIPKYPYVSVGYYPSSQLSLMDNQVLVENQYNTFNIIMSHSYQFKQTGMNTNAVFTKFYNTGSDSNFIYYNASSFTVNHSIYLGKFTLQSTMAIIDQQLLNLFTVEQKVGYQFKNTFSLSGSLKWNRLNKAENLFGVGALMNMYIKRLGTLQFNYEKTYLPSYNRTLIPVDIGRMSFFRQF